MKDVIGLNPSVVGWNELSARAESGTRARSTSRLVFFADRAARPSRSACFFGKLLPLAMDWSSLSKAITAASWSAP